MKKKESKKFGFEKFEVAKLKNSRLIQGGDTTNTDTVDKASTQQCNNSDDNDDSGVICAIKDIFRAQQF